MSYTSDCPELVEGSRAGGNPEGRDRAGNSLRRSRRGDPCGRPPLSPTASIPPLIPAPAGIQKPRAQRRSLTPTPFPSFLRRQEPRGAAAGRGTPHHATGRRTSPLPPPPRANAVPSPTLTPCTAATTAPRPLALSLSKGRDSLPLGEYPSCICNVPTQLQHEKQDESPQLRRTRKHFGPAHPPDPKPSIPANGPPAGSVSGQGAAIPLPPPRCPRASTSATVLSWW